MGNGSIRFKDISGNTLSYISGSGTDIFISGGTLNLSGLTGFTIGNVLLSGTSKNAETSSFSPNYLLTASFVTYSGSINTTISTLEINTGSYATTGSNTFIGDQIISGSLSVTQNITGSIISGSFKGDGSKLHIISALGTNALAIGETGSTQRLALGQESSYTGNYINSSNIDLKLITIRDGGTGGHMTFYTSTDTNPIARLSLGTTGIACFSSTVCAPCFATISDYRMKYNQQPIEGLSIIMNTKPVKFNYCYDCSTSFGMIAHELQEILPEAVFGEKDGEVMQGIDYMKLLPITIKAIQEQQCEIKQLKLCLGIN